MDEAAEKEQMTYLWAQFHFLSILLILFPIHSHFISYPFYLTTFLMYFVTWKREIELQYFKDFLIQYTFVQPLVHARHCVTCCVWGEKWGQGDVTERIDIVLSFKEADNLMF